MFTLPRPLAAVTGVGLGAGAYLFVHHRPMLGLLIVTGFVVGGVLVFIVATIARQNAYNRRATHDFRQVLIADAAHHADRERAAEAESREVSR